MRNEPPKTARRHSHWPIRAALTDTEKSLRLGPRGAATLRPSSWPRLRHPCHLPRPYQQQHFQVCSCPLLACTDPIVRHLYRGPLPAGLYAGDAPPGTTFQAPSRQKGQHRRPGQGEAPALLADALGSHAATGAPARQQALARAASLLRLKPALASGRQRVVPVAMPTESAHALLPSACMPEQRVNAQPQGTRHAAVSVHAAAGLSAASTHSSAGCTAGEPPTALMSSRCAPAPRVSVPAGLHTGSQQQRQEQERQQKQEQRQQSKQQQQQEEQLPQPPQPQPQQQEPRADPMLKPGSFAHARDFLHRLAAGARHSGGSLPSSSSQRPDGESGSGRQVLPAQLLSTFQLGREASRHSGKASGASGGSARLAGCSVPSSLPGRAPARSGQLLHDAGTMHGLGLAAPSSWAQLRAPAAPEEPGSPSGSSHPGSAAVQPAPASPSWQTQLLSSPAEQLLAGGRRAAGARPAGCTDSGSDDLDALLLAAAKRRKRQDGTWEQATWGAAAAGAGADPDGGVLSPLAGWQHQPGAGRHDSAWPGRQNDSPPPAEQEDFLQSLQQDAPTPWQQAGGGGQGGWAVLPRSDGPGLNRQLLQPDHFLQSLQSDELVAPWERGHSLQCWEGGMTSDDDSPALL